MIIRQEIKTKRLLLRRPRTEDAEKIVSAISKDVVRLMGGIPWPYRKNHATDFINIDKKHWGKKGFNFVIIFEEKIIGCISLKSYSEKRRQAQIGFWLGKDYWGQGIMTEAAKALLEFSFVDLNLVKVHSGASPKNIGSWKVLDKIGMRRLCIMKKEYLTSLGKLEDMYYYEILKEEFNN